MRTALNLDERLPTRAARLSGIREKTALLHARLEALIARESARAGWPPSAVPNAS